MKRIDQINPTAPGFNGEPLFLPLRKPGGEFWSSVRQQDERKQQMDAIGRKIKEQDDKLAELAKFEEAWNDFEKDKAARLAKPEEFKDVVSPKTPSLTLDEILKQRSAANDFKSQFESQLEKLTSDSAEVNLPPALKEDKRDNFILLGPAGCGKTTACNFLSQEQQRAYIRID